MALVGFVDFLAIGRGPWSRRFCLFMACTAPFAAQAVMQFRPDFAAGLLTAIGVVLVLRSNFAESSRRHQAAAGVAFGLALLVKPTGSPFTLAMTGGTLVLATLCDWRTRPGLTVRQVASSWAWCVGPLLALAGPHYALAWRSVAKIVALNTTSPQAKVWTMSGGQVFPWYYYLTGLGGRMMLRNSLACSAPSARRASCSSSAPGTGGHRPSRGIRAGAAGGLGHSDDAAYSVPSPPRRSGLLPSVPSSLWVT
jgi:hypothetical protein